MAAILSSELEVAEESAESFRSKLDTGSFTSQRPLLIIGHNYVFMNLVLSSISFSMAKKVCQFVKLVSHARGD